MNQKTIRKIKNREERLAERRLAENANEKTEKIQEILARIAQNEAKKAKLLKILDHWAAVEMMGLKRSDVRCFAVRENIVAVLHNGKKVVLDYALEELKKARKS